MHSVVTSNRRVKTNYYAPQISKNLGLNGTQAGLFAASVYGIVKMTMCACFLVLAADSLGRRRFGLWTSIATELAMLYVGLHVRISPPVCMHFPESWGALDYADL